MFTHKYLTREHLEGFDNYKYMAIDTSPLSVYVMHPFWNRVVEFIPKWVAPNVLTFGGFLLIVLDFILLSYYDYSYYAATSQSYNTTAGASPLNGYQEVIPQNLWYFIGVMLFLAYTLDGIDGKQARRTQTSGPLGELFDHGLDSYTVFFIPACLYSIFGRNDFSIPPIRIYYIMWNLLLNFYLSHWEKYNTGVLFLPWGYDFSMWASTMLFLWTGANGTTFYKRYAFGSYTVANVFEWLIYATGASTILFLWTGANGTTFYKRYAFGSYTVANVFEWLIYATGVATNVPVALYNIYKSYSLRTGKMRSPLEAIRPLWSFLFIFLVVSYWVHKSNNLPDYDLRVIFLLQGTLFSNVACRLIVSQMSDQRCDMTNSLLYPLSIAVLLSLTVPQYEMFALYSVTLIAVLSHLHYGCCVVRQMCDHFRINCFHIKERSD